MISMSSDAKKDDSSIDNAIGIESSIVKIGDCTTDDIIVNLEFYFDNQLIANETLRVSIKFPAMVDFQGCLCPSDSEQVENIMCRFSLASK